MNSLTSYVMSHPALLAFIALVCAVCAWQIVCLLGARSALRSRNARSAFRGESQASPSENRQQGSSKQTDEKLDRSPDLIAAGLHLSTKQWTTARFSLALVALAGGCISGLPLAGVGFGAAVLLGSQVWLGMRKKKALGELEKQVLQLEMQMAENSRAGLSVERSLRACLEHAEFPIQEHLERMVNELTFSNRTLTDAFEGFARRSESDDVRLLANVIAVQQETGSNLAETLDFLSATISEKQRMRQTLRSRVAEMQLTKIMVSAAPVLVLAICCVCIEGVTEFYTTNPVGWVLLGVCAAADIGGLWALGKMSDIEID